MLTKRIIACLDIKDGQTVKGIKFENIIYAGDPIDLAKQYELVGVDELVFLDISASQEKRKTIAELSQKIAQNLSTPFCVGGGISKWQDAVEIIKMGADKITINSAAVKKPNLISEIANKLGRQAVVVSIDAKKVKDEWKVFIKGGKEQTEKELFSWAKESVERGAGEIMFTSMDHDGTKDGFAVQALKELSETLTVPVIASGGAGNMEHFAELFHQTQCQAGLAASIFHFEEMDIVDLKNYLAKKNIPIRVV